jgi:lysophospholipase L1-like esterase
MNPIDRLPMKRILALFALTTLIASSAPPTEIPDEIASAASPPPPRVLLIGDSIMSGYFPVVARALGDEAKVSRHPGNAGDTRNGLKKLDAWLGETSWDVIHFNWGLHDLCYRHPESKVYGNRDKERGTLSVSLEDYRKNLVALVERLEQTGARLIWATITTVPEGEAGRFTGDEDRYNQVALEVMRRHDIPVNDLNRLTDTFEAGLFVKPADVHYTAAANQKLGQQVAAAIRRHGLESEPTE